MLNASKIAFASAAARFMAAAGGCQTRPLPTGNPCSEGTQFVAPLGLGSFTSLTNDDVCEKSRITTAMYETGDTGFQIAATRMQMNADPEKRAAIEGAAQTMISPEKLRCHVEKDGGVTKLTNCFVVSAPNMTPTPKAETQNATPAPAAQTPSNRP